MSRVLEGTGRPWAGFQDAGSLAPGFGLKTAQNVFEADTSPYVARRSIFLPEIYGVYRGSGLGGAQLAKGCRRLGRYRHLDELDNESSRWG